MRSQSNRREFLLRSGFSFAAANLLMGLPSMAGVAGMARASGVQTPKKRLVIVFSPNGVIPDHFWPDQEGADFELKRILQPLADFKSQMLTLHGVCNRIQGTATATCEGLVVY